MKPVLYITYDGLLDPLGQSQVLPYLLGLRAVGVQFVILSYEKPAQLIQPAASALKRSLASRGFVWYALKYHKSPAILAKCYDVVRGWLLAIFVIVRHRLSIVHARSYVAALIALGAKRVTGCKFIFDMRGLWADERVDGHWWRSDSSLFRIAKRCETSFLRHADHVVVLTSGLKALLPEFPVMKRRPELPISVIPTCVELNRFQGHQSPGTPQAHAVSCDPFTYVYLGSVGSLYLLDEVVRFFRVALERNSRASLLVMTNGPEDGVQSLLAEHGVPRDRYQMLNLPYEEVPRHLAGAQASLFFTKPCYSRIGKYSTKFGESLASGLLVVTNRGSVDIDTLLEQHRVGIVIDQFTHAAYQDALERLEALLGDPGLRDRCRQVAADHLAMERGVCAYQRVYNDLSTALVER